MSRHAQTATEYLILTVVVIIVAILVTVSLRGVFNSGDPAGEASARGVLISGKIGISDISAQSNQTVFSIQNNLGKRTTLTAAYVNGKLCRLSQPLVMTIGVKKKMVCPPANTTSNPLAAGDKAIMTFAFNYTDDQTQATYQFTPTQQLAIAVGSDAGAYAGSLLTGLLAYYKLDDPVPASNASDATGHGIDGTIPASLTSYTGVLSGAAFFDGTSQYLSVGVPGSGITSVSNRTVSLWLNIPQSAPGGAVFNFVNDNNYALEPYLAYNDDNDYAQITSTFWSGCSSDLPENHQFPSVAYNTWHQYVVTVNDNGSRTGYLDGTKVYDAPYALTSCTPGVMEFGRNTYWDAEFLHMYLDEATIWNTTFNDANVSYYYNSGSGRTVTGNEQGLVAAYHLDDAFTTSSFTASLDDPSVVTPLTFNYAAGSNGGCSNYYEFEVYAYKTVNGVRIYSQNPAIFTGTDDCSLSYAISFSWTEVSGADGYRIIAVADPWYGSAYHIDTLNTAANIDVDYDTISGNDVVAGTTVTPKPGFIGYIPVADSSGLDIDGVMTGAMGSVTGALGNAMSTTPGNSIETPPNTYLSNVNNFSIAAWLNENSRSSYQAFFSHRNGCDVAGWTTQFYTLASDACGVQGSLMIMDSGDNRYDTCFTPGSLNSWHQYVGVYDGANLSVYVDGVMVSSSSIVAQTATMSAPFHIGDDSCGNGLNGNLDEVAIWNRALNATEVTALYNGGNGLAIK